MVDVLITQTFSSADADFSKGLLRLFATGTKRSDNNESIVLEFANDAGLTAVARGHDFTLDAQGRLKTGTLDSLEFVLRGEVIWSLKGAGSADLGLSLARPIAALRGGSDLAVANAFKSWDVTFDGTKAPNVQVKLFAGDDTFKGSGGSDRMHGVGGNDRLFGRAGNDDLAGGSGDDLINGGSGRDLANFWQSDGTGATKRAVVVDLAAGTASGQGNDRLISIEAVGGSRGDDVIKGNSAGNSLWGDVGKDSLYGRGGGDTLYGGFGNDKIFGEGGADLLAGQTGYDTINGGAGRDRVSYLWGEDGKHSPWWVNIDLQTGIAKETRVIALGVFHTYTDRISSIENVVGSRLSDSIRGNSADNVFEGMRGTDRIDGRAGDDTIAGQDGKDTLTGGTGKDRFVFSGWGPDHADLITDFNAAEDAIVLDAQVFGSLGSIDYDELSGQLSYKLPGSNHRALIATLEDRPDSNAVNITMITLTPDFWG